MYTTIFATKKGMIQAWDKSGKRSPITICSSFPHTITQIKTSTTDNYSAIQVGFLGTKKSLNKPQARSLKKAKIEGKLTKFKEISGQIEEAKVGDLFTAIQVLKVGDSVKATGTSIGKGFSGVVKRWGFAGGPKTHGQSDRTRAPGSIGQGTDPGRVWKGKKMPGRQGGKKQTVKNLTVVKIEENGEIWLKGSIPGFKGSLIKITKTGETKFSGLSGQEETKPQTTLAKQTKESQAKDKNQPAKK